MSFNPLNSGPDMEVTGFEQEGLTLLLIGSETVGTRFKHPEVKTSADEELSVLCCCVSVFLLVFSLILCFCFLLLSLLSLV